MSDSQRMGMRFFVGLHQPSDAQHFDSCFVSVNRLRDRKGPFQVRDWIMDSGAFSEISRHGRYRQAVKEYADQIKRWKDNGNLLAAVTQDYMCEAFILKKTGLTVAEHQRLTIERWAELESSDTGCYIMPVLQGYEPEDYLSHLEQYGDALAKDTWVGVGSVCKRNTSPCVILDILGAIKEKRPDLRLHGFGLKLTALGNGTIRSLLHSADSMAWSFAARREGRDANDWRNARAFKEAIERPFAYQGHFLELQNAI